LKNNKIKTHKLCIVLIILIIFIIFLLIFNNSAIKAQNTSSLLSTVSIKIKPLIEVIPKVVEVVPNIFTRLFNFLFGIGI